MEQAMSKRQSAAANQKSEGPVWETTHTLRIKRTLRALTSRVHT
jgi:hypothetical protein